MQVSNTFSNGTIADADDVNENFDDVVGPLNTGWTPSNTNPTCATNNVLTLNNADEFIAVGEKMEITVSSVVYYGYATAVSGSSITGIWATNAGVAYTLTAGSLITSFRYSKGNPIGFPHAFATAIGFVRFEGATMIQYGSITITCASGSDNAAGTINFPTGLNFADTTYTFTTSGARSPSFATVNEMAFTCHSTHTAAQAVITLFTRAGTWAANRSPVVYWRAEGKI